MDITQEWIDGQIEQAQAAKAQFQANANACEGAISALLAAKRQLQTQPPASTSPSE